MFVACITMSREMSSLSDKKSEKNAPLMPWFISCPKSAVSERLSELKPVPSVRSMAHPLWSRAPDVSLE